MRLRRLLPLLILTACSGDPAGPRLGPGDVRVAVTPQATSTPWGWAAAIQVENPSSRTIYILDHCGAQVMPRLQRQEGGGWVDVPNGIVCLAVATPPIAIAAGGRYEGSIPLSQLGRYRMTIRFGTSAENAWEEQSPEFAVPPED